jgi:hypothetical protein
MDKELKRKIDELLASKNTVTDKDVEQLTDAMNTDSLESLKDWERIARDNFASIVESIYRS